MLGIEIWTWSADHHTGPWLKNATRKGLTEGSTRSHTYKVRNFLHYGRQPQKALWQAIGDICHLFKPAE